MGQFEYTGISRLSVLNEGAERVFPEDETLSDRSNTVRMINRMPDDKIWLGPVVEDCIFYGISFETIESSQKMDSNIYAVEEGADGSIWLGSRGNGLSIDGNGTLITRMILCLLEIIISLLTGTERIECG